MKDLKLPLHQQNNQLVSINDNAQEFVIVENAANNGPKYKIGALICLGVIFYFLFCGIDSYFQSQTYTYGLCGPLELSSDTAGNSLRHFFRTKTRNYLALKMKNFMKYKKTNSKKYWIDWTNYIVHTNNDY